MSDLILRSFGLSPPGKPYALQIRKHESLGETEYYTICYVSLEMGKEIVKAGAPYWMFGEPQEKPVEKVHLQETTVTDIAHRLAKEIDKPVVFTAKDGCEVTVTPTGHVFHNVGDWW